jgi:conjugal transfer pilus assembly protein TraE
MTPSKHTSSSVANAFNGRVLSYSLMLSLALNVLIMGTFLLRDKTHRETLVPPTIHKTFWVEDENIDTAYMEQMGVFLLQLILNTTPATSDVSITTFLQYTGPESYGRLEKILRAQAAQLKAGAVSTVFYPRSVTVAPGAKNSIAIAGVLSSFGAERRLPDRAITYLMRFRFSGGRLYLAELSEVADGNADATDLAANGPGQASSSPPTSAAPGAAR